MEPPEELGGAGARAGPQQMRRCLAPQPVRCTPSCPGGAGGRGRPEKEGAGGRRTAGSGAEPLLQDPGGGAKAPLPRSVGPGAPSPPGLAVAAPQPAQHRPRAPERRRPGERSCAPPLPTGGGLGRRSPGWRRGRTAAAPPTAPPAPRRRRCCCCPLLVLRTRRCVAGREEAPVPGTAGGGPAPPARPFCRRQQQQKLPSKPNQNKKTTTTTKPKKHKGEKKRERETRRQHRLSGVRGTIFNFVGPRRLVFWYLMRPMRSPRSLLR